ncbi:hypothetical protein BJX66DRAFT_349669 [Aspergillus keveii]|uniref:Short-chain dehydrogenase n=1 Tax=Aspergillus keveii TaxID=714993 RepID=A0ABR4FJ30_9EURO
MKIYQNKIVLITGAARGIGQAIALEFATAGAIVVMADVQNEPQEAVAAQLRNEGHKAFAFHCDVANDDSVSALGSAVLEKLGCPDIIYNNAVLVRTGGVLNADLNAVRKELDVNVLGYLRIVQQFLPQMVLRGSGWIINTASPNAFVPPPIVAENLMGYCISKAAEVSMSHCMSVSLKPKGINVSVVFPDITYTDSVKELHGSASNNFNTDFASFITNEGRPATEVAARIVKGLDPNKFFFSVYNGFEGMLKTWASQKMDPGFNYLASSAL